MSSISEGQKMIQWMRDLWHFPRSLTGHGTYNTLQYLKDIHNELVIHSYVSGTNVFDWQVPDEWNIEDAYIEHETGERFAEFSKHNLHVLGYSLPCDKELTKEELLPFIYTQPDQPDYIPYVTSYYQDRWGFCMSENEKQKLPEGKYKAVIKATKGPGKLHLADLQIEGENKEELFFSTYVCHPSMANNELSGPVLSTALIEYVKKKYPSPKMSYRFAFLPETIGSICYMSDRLDEMKDNIVAGFNLSCVGDDRAYSHVASRLGDCLADKAIQAAFIGRENVKNYSFLSRGSDERQYCAPGIDLPLCGFSRTRYGDYPEYHTDADNFDVVTAEGLQGAFDVMSSIIDAFEMGLYPQIQVLGEPQLGKRGLYPNISQKGSYGDINTRMDFLAYADGKHNLFEIGQKIGVNLNVVCAEAKLMADNKLVKFV